jgi:hypothetical protein
MFSCPYNAGEFNEIIGVLICRPTGVLTADRARDVAICRECIVKAGIDQVHRFHDLTGITGIELRYDDVERLCRIESGYRKPDHPVKACHLVSSPSFYGTHRMYRTLAESRGVEVHVGYDIEKLAAVLEVDPAQLGRSDPA